METLQCPVCPCCQWLIVHTTINHLNPHTKLPLMCGAIIDFSWLEDRHASVFEGPSFSRLGPGLWMIALQASVACRAVCQELPSEKAPEHANLISQGIIAGILTFQSREKPMWIKVFHNLQIMACWKAYKESNMGRLLGWGAQIHDRPGVCKMERYCIYQKANNNSGLQCRMFPNAK